MKTATEYAKEAQAAERAIKDARKVATERAIARLEKTPAYQALQKTFWRTFLKAERMRED